MIRLTEEEEIAAVAAAVVALAGGGERVAEATPPQDPAGWRFQNRWWVQVRLRRGGIR